MKTSPYRRVVGILVVASSSFFSLCAQNRTAADKCGAEIKLLLVPAEIQSAVKAFRAGSPTNGHIYLFDTETLELFSRGVILRVRKGAKATDLMVKVRVPVDQALSSDGLERDYKCEVDRSDDAAVRSYSVLSKIAGPLPDSGKDVLRLLSPAQKRLLKTAHISPDWNRVQMVVDVTSTVWRIVDEPSLTRLALEMWQWHSGQLLELSTKTVGDGDSVETQLRQTVARKGLSVSATQEQKTALALGKAKRLSSP